MNKSVASSPHYVGHRKRLRERFAKTGIVADYELIEMLLFLVIPRADVKELAKTILNKFEGNFLKLFNATPQNLKQIPGVSEHFVHVISLVNTLLSQTLKDRVSFKSVLSDYSSVIDYCRHRIAYSDVENLLVLYLDTKNQIIFDEIAQKGTVNQTPIYPREILKKALEISASNLILVHNHPSGDPTPSPGDLIMTEQVCEGAKALGLKVHDHIILGKNDHRSLRALGIIEG